MLSIDEVLTRGVAEILPTKEGLEKLMKRRPIKLYQGFDATAPSLHIGHMIGIRKLAQFQQLGHKVIFLIGDFTSLIGDPTDKGAARVKQTPKQVKENFKNYKKQVSRIIDFEGENKAKVLYNSTWLSKLKFEDVLELSSSFTVQQMLERSMFQERIKKEKPIYLHEFMYPLMQGYDAVEMGVDLQVGGSDQLFNMLAGRVLMGNLKKKEMSVLTMKLLEDPGGKKMGKTEGNAVNLDDPPEDTYGRIMSLPDGFVDRGIELMTDLPLDHQKKVGPLEAKKDWAFETVKQIHGSKRATEAKKHFEKTFQKSTPAFDKKVKNENSLLDFVASAASVSRSEAKRLITSSSVRVNEIVEKNHKSSLKKGDKVKIGKKMFVTVS